jgi:NAD(P)-dependent dehydrogenase (short-subunit alcohol dehydrogenase family)
VVELAGRVAGVTGGGNGIGAALVRRFAAEAAAGVFVADLDEVAARRVAAEVVRGGGTAVAHRVDVADRAQVEAMIAAAEAELGPVDLVCSNAGIGTGQGLEADPATWTRAWDVNVMAHVHAAHAALPGMLERGYGAFVHTCSAAGLLTMIGDAPYTATKHAAVGFAEWLAITYGNRGIHVSALCPQGVETQLLSQGAGSIPEQAVRLAGVVLSPDEVAAAVVAGLHEERFLVLPHPEVGDHLRRKGADPERWIGALTDIATQLGADGR